MILTRPITIIVNDAHPERCSRACPLWKDIGIHFFCGNDRLEHEDGHEFRTPECLRDAKEKDKP
jgi:hypothetical protein